MTKYQEGRLAAKQARYAQNNPYAWMGLTSYDECENEHGTLNTYFEYEDSITSLGEIKAVEEVGCPTLADCKWKYALIADTLETSVLSGEEAVEMAYQVWKGAGITREEIAEIESVRLLQKPTPQQVGDIYLTANIETILEMWSKNSYEA